MSVHLRIVRVFGQAVVLLRSTLAQVKERVRVPDVANAEQDYGGTRAIDHDDGSKFFIDSENVLVGSGVKNFLGNTKHFIGNLMIGAGEKGICCCKPPRYRWRQG